MNVRPRNVWAGCVASLAIAVAAVGSAFAANEDEQTYSSPSEQARQREQQQWQRDQNVSRDAQRSAQERSSSREQRDSNNQGGLGVNIRSDGGPGVVIIRVNRDTPAAHMGLEPRDRITHVDGQRVESVNAFIDQIRGKNPGEQVELQVRRANSRNEETIQGKLQSRQQAVVARRQQNQRDVWQSGYDEERGYGDSEGRSPRGQSTARLQQIEQQVDRLSQQIEQLRYALRDYREQSNREQQAGYNEYQSDRPRRSAERWQGSESNQYRDGSREGQRSRNQGVSRDAQRSAPGQQGQSPREYQGEGPRFSEPQNDSPGGEVGEDRLNVGTEETRE